MYPCLTFQHVLQIVPPLTRHLQLHRRESSPAAPQAQKSHQCHPDLRHPALLLQIITLSYLTPGDADLFTTRVPTFLTFLTSAIIDIRWIPDDPYACQVSRSSGAVSNQQRGASSRDPATLLLLVTKHEDHECAQIDRTGEYFYLLGRVVSSKWLQWVSRSVV